MFINILRLQLFILLMGNWFKDPNTSLFSRFGSQHQHGPFCSRICTAFFKMNSFGSALSLTGQTKSLRLYVVFVSPSHWRFLRWVRCSFSKIKKDITFRQTLLSSGHHIYKGKCLPHKTWLVLASEKVEPGPTSSLLVVFLKWYETQTF